MDNRGSNKKVYGSDRTKIVIKGNIIKRSIATVCLIFVLFRLGDLQLAAQQNGTTSYARMAPFDRYLTSDRNAEIALARSAAPKSISQDAEIFVLEPHGYEIAAKGKNGFVCAVERSWMLPFDNPEFWDPKVRLPLCLNPPAARTHLPLTFKTTGLVVKGLSKTQILDAIKAAFDRNELPLPEPGSMCYMMSKQQTLVPSDGNADPHLMFSFPQRDHVNWARNSPIPR